MAGNFVQHVSRTVGFSPGIVFDVGANVGQTVQGVLARWETTKVFAFEPASAAFAELRRRWGTDPRVRLNRVALSNTVGEVRFSAEGTSTGNHILAESESGDSEVVQVRRGDDFCRDEGLSRIDLLKVDTEGYDLDVLLGFAGLLSAGKIQYIQVECTTNLDNRFHVHLERFIHFLHPFNYRVFGIYDFSRKCFKTNQPLMGSWFCNAVFVREVENPRLRRDGKN